jgi:hypothetical protein
MRKISLCCAEILCSRKCILKKNQRAYLRHCVRSLPRLLNTSSKETSHPCHRILNNESYPANVRRATRRHLESHNVIYVVPAWSMPKKTHTTEREPSIASETISLRGVRPFGQPGNHKLTLVTNRGGFDFMPIYKPYSGQRN